MMIKVLHVIPSLSPLRGGPSMALAVMAGGLVKAGLQVDIATTDDNGGDRLSVSLRQPIVKDGYTVWYFPRQTLFYTMSWPLAQWLAVHVSDYHVVHIHALFTFSALPASVQASRARIPYIVRPIGVLSRWGMERRRPLLKRLSYYFLERRILERATLVHYTSEQERIEAQALGVKTTSVVIPLAADLPTEFLCAPNERHPIPRNLAQPLTILFLSRLDPKKGLDLLIPAFAELHKKVPQSVLVLVGDGEPNFVALLKAQIMALGISASVVWAGFLKDTEKFSVIASADMFVLPSYSENFGMAVVEVMACGVPVIVSDQVGLCEEIASGQAGLVVPCQAEALTKAMLNLAGDANLRQRLGQNGRQLVYKRFSPEVVTQQLVQMYRATIARAS